MPVRHVPYAEIRDDLHRLSASIVWAVLTTVDPSGRPRGRIVHPVWREADGRAEGLVAVRPTPVKLADVAANPHVSLSYWTPAFESLFIDAVATWVPEGDRRAAWTTIAEMPPPLGYDPSPMWPDGPDAPGFAVLRLDPFRIRIQLGSETAKGLPDRFWTRRDG